MTFEELSQSLHHVVLEHIVNGHQAHTQMVGHIGAHHLPVLVSGEAGWGVVHSLIETVAALQPHVPQAPQIAQSTPGGQQQSQKG